MSKKLRSWRALFCTLAVLTTIAIIIACGDGQPVDITSGEISGDINVASDVFIDEKMPAILSQASQTSSSEEEPSSSSKDNNNDNSSSSEKPSTQSSSSKESGNTSSSSNEAQKSSNSSQYSLTCSVRNKNVAYKLAYDAAEVADIIKIECKRSNTTINLHAINDINWSNNGSTIRWSNMTAGTYASIKIVVSNDEETPGCQGMDYICTDGPLTISVQSSSSKPSSSSVYNPPVTTSSSSNNPPPVTTSSSSTGGGTGGPCRDSNNALVYCKWDGKCSAIDNSTGWMGTTEATQTCGPNVSTLCTCAALIQNCKDYGDGKTVWTTSNCTAGGGGTSSSSGSGGNPSSNSSGDTNITLKQSATEYAPATYTVTDYECKNWGQPGNKLRCSNDSGKLCSVTINGTTYENNSCNGYCELGTNLISTPPFTMKVNSTSKLSCGS